MSAVRGSVQDVLTMVANSRRCDTQLRKLLKTQRKRLFSPRLLVIPALLLLYLRYRTPAYEIPANPRDISYPLPHHNLTEFVHEHADRANLPVFVLYPSERTGQLNNQLIALINALCIAHTLNATLIAPHAHYGAESHRDFRAAHPFRIASVFRTSDTLVGDYIDAAQLNNLHPVVPVDDFLASRAGKALRALPRVLVRSGEAEDYYASLQGRVRITGKTTRKEEVSDGKAVASKRELDCEFDAANYFRGVEYRAGVNANFVFLPSIFRSHAVDCSEREPYWLHARRYIQPCAELRALVKETIDGWGGYIAVHLRFLPFDKRWFDADGFFTMMKSRFGERLQDAGRVYVAHSVTCKMSVEVVRKMEAWLGERIVTAKVFGDVYARGGVFDKRYSIPLLDMWTCVKSAYFIGRSASSLSRNVRYWREALGEGDAQSASYAMYKLEEFSNIGKKNLADRDDVAKSSRYRNTK